MLVGINNQTIKVKNVMTGDRCVRFHVANKSDNFEWALVAVYGAAQDAQKADFLAELVRFCEDDSIPILVGGDFNIIRRQNEKNNDNFNGRWPLMFNAIIESLLLKEIALSGRQFTWANRRDTPTFEKLDRVLVSVPWELKFPLVSVQALARAGSDHTPLLLDTGEQAHLGNKKLFSFELAWLKHEGFRDLIATEWSKGVPGKTAIEIWQNKIRNLRKFLRGWAKNLSGVYRNERNRLIKIIEELDLKAETSVLTMAENSSLREANDLLGKLRRDEELKWAQRAKVKHVQEGGITQSISTS
jgi:hypothetical protein